MRSIELVMEAYAVKLGEDADTWAIAGLLHDADYEAHPDKHPDVIVEKLNAMGENAIAHAISAHYTKWNVPYNSLLDKALLACDEITGFVIACCQVRPDGINSLESKSVIKKLKDKSFAAKVERDEVYKGAELFGVDLNDHIAFIITVLRNNKSELGVG
jgi:predicted hydrolase (HD superfamily)